MYGYLAGKEVLILVNDDEGSLNAIDTRYMYLFSNF